MGINIRPTFDEVTDMILDIGKKIAEHDDVHIDVIVALARGGAVGGVMLSHLLDTRVVFPSYSSKEGQGDDRNHDNVLPEMSGQTILVFDDILDSGNSVREVVEFYNERRNTVIVATLYQKETSCITAEFFAQCVSVDDGFIYFPWEL